ncbi:cell division protein FtsQ/DivIB [Agaribacterium sp. ZY112]|uniref:cell division protein FtsQ/DivIB n=1 Tax=Agaribacterium sp. ZY112 TaxID=3233574 RepID=UPI003523D932
MARRAAKKQALAKRVRPSQEPRRKLGRYIVLVFALVAVTVFLKPFQFLQTVNVSLPSVSFDDEVEISNVVIEGELRYSNRQELQALIKAFLEDDFVRLNLNEMRAELEAEPWLKTVRLARKWPSTLKVEIEEQQPIARWGDEGFVNRYGELVLLDELSALSELPLLEGESSEAYEIARSYLLMSQLLNEAGLYINELRVSAQGARYIEFDSGFSLLLGEYQFKERLEKFLFLYKEQLAQHQQRLLSVDLRYDNGVAVQWQDESVTEIASR